MQKVYLNDEEMAEVLSVKNGCFVLSAILCENSLHLVMRINDKMYSFSVPLNLFTPSGDGTAPDFSKLSLDEYGHGVIFGDYEVAADFLKDQLNDFRSN